MKFDVKFWLFYSALIGFFPGFIVFCISLVMLELPAPLAFLIGIAVALAIGFAMQMSNISKEKKVEADRMAKAKRDFYLSCRSARISSEHDLESPEKKQLLQQIANKYNIPYSSFDELVQLYQDEEQKYSA